MNSPTPALSVLILNLNKPELIAPLVEALKREEIVLKQAGWALEVLIGDTGSSDPATLKIYSELPDYFKIVFDLKYHFSKNNNELARRARFENLVFLNNDVIWADSEHPLLKLTHHLSLYPQNVYGPVMFFENAAVQHAGVALTLSEDRLVSYHPLSGIRIAVDQFKEQSPFVALTGAFLCLSKSLFGSLKGFDELYESECQDVDLCLKAVQAGHECVLLNLGSVHHLENSTRPKGEEHEGDRILFSKRWMGSFQKHKFGFGFLNKNYGALNSLHIGAFVGVCGRLVFRKLKRKLNPN